MAKKLSLTERMKAQPITLRGPKTWISVLPEDVQRELEQLRSAFHTGQFSHTKSDVYTFVCDELKLSIKRGTFVRWLQEKPNA